MTYDPHPAWVHPTAIVAGADLADGCIVWQFSTILPGARLGVNVSVGSNTEIGRHVLIGDGCRIGRGVFIPNRTVIGQRVFIGPNAVLTDDRHPVVANPHYKAEPPEIGDDVSIGAGAVLLPGVRLGQGCCIGAGAVVTRDVMPYATVVGNPARVLYSRMHQEIVP